MSEPILLAEGLVTGYGPAQVLFGVDLALRPGEVVALMGRNGAGKSTTMKALIGLLPVRQGRVAFAGADIGAEATHRIARRGLGYVPEERRVFAELTVAENLEVGRRPAPPGQPAWTPERLFAIFPNLAELRTRRAGAMSGGEQQMLAIARTLMGNPRAVLLDEPSEGLAPVIVELMEAAVRRMKQEGVAVLLSEQNLDFAAAVADRAYIMERGSIRFAGSMAALVEDERLRDTWLAV
jgi:branched-chain amino acid transport system ATP-binding protein